MKHKHIRMLLWIVVGIIAVKLCFICAKSFSHNGNDNIKTLNANEDFTKDPTNYEDPLLKPFYEDKDIIGVAVYSINDNNQVIYFTLKEYDENDTQRMVDNIPDHNIRTINKGIWDIKDGALTFYSGEGNLFKTIIDGYIFDGEYGDGLCYIGLGDIGYAPIQSKGTKLKNFLWKEDSVSFWACLAPESEAGRIFKPDVRPSPILNQGLIDITYLHGRDDKSHFRNLTDGDSQTEWIIGDKEFKKHKIDTEGHFPRLIFLRPSKKEPIRLIRILNGSYSYGEDGINWENYSRVKELVIMGCTDDSRFADNLFSGTLPNEMGWQTIEISKPDAYDFYSIIIDDYYPGKTYNDIAISEIMFYP